MRSIDEIYAPFGREVCEEVRRCAATSGDISALLARLQLPPSGSISAQHETLKAFIFQYGVAFFLEMVRSHRSPAEVEAAKAAMLLRRLTGDTRSQAVPKRPEAGIGDSNAKQASSAVSPSSSVSPAPAPTSGPSSPAASPSPSATGERKFIVTATYVGPDRRSGRDRRRASHDRRLKVELIFQNKRYGGRERRKSKRRAEDREKP
ncbi:MAG: hypothetical protein N2644_10130 [Candidatus Sumerlaea chitinivorans]|nr:hypothetical protein [Candidatus Sumerlaea chitinivorans]